MVKYECSNPECKYVSDDVGECCNQALIQLEHGHEEHKKEHGAGKCDCCP